jgi:hypothetical protein
MQIFLDSENNKNSFLKMYEKIILTIVIIMTLSHQTKCIQKCRVDCLCYKDNENNSVLQCEKGVNTLSRTQHTHNII